MESTKVNSLFAKYRDFLPVSDSTPQLSLGEGNTPLLKADRLGELIGCPNLFLKYEGLNPTGSFKDRGMVVATAKALEREATAIVCASTGNTAASAAAYAAKAGIRCYVILPAGYVAPGKLAQAFAYGAEVVPIVGSFDQALELVLQATEALHAELVNSLNPFRIEGQKTSAFEVCDGLGKAPDVVALPVGNAGNITAYWKGFMEYKQAHRTKTLPEMWGFQAAGAAPLVKRRPVEHPDTVATAIRIGRPARGKEALKAVRESHGLLDAVTDEEIMEAYRLVASCEGIMCEPASAAPLAGIRKKVHEGKDFSDSTVVVVLTGHGLKDPGAAVATIKERAPIEPSVHAILDALGY